MFWSNGIATLHHADARNIPLPDKSVHMCVTSPPYYGLRNYALGGWEGGDAECSHSLGMPQEGEWSTFRSKRYINNATFNSEQSKDNTCGLCGATQSPEGIGLEPTLAEHLENIVLQWRGRCGVCCAMTEVSG